MQVSEIIAQAIAALADTVDETVVLKKEFF